MKRIILVFALMLLMTSCSLGDDDQSNFYTEYVPIESVGIPTEFVLGETYEIRVRYFRPTNCHVFNDFYYQSELNQRTVAVINTVYPNNDCLPLINEEEQVSFTFQVISNGVYVFKFWQGKDENGNDTYLIVEVPVVE